MSEIKTRSRFLRGWRLFVFVFCVYVISVTVIRLIVQPPGFVGLSGEPRKAIEPEFLVDSSWLDENGERQLSQQLFDRVIANIKQAEQLILLDMFLFNDWQGPVAESHRSLSGELTDALIERKSARSSMDIIVISDPINTVYQGTESAHFNRLRAAGIHVSLTDLTGLQDSNPVWSGMWRWLIRPFGNAEADTLPNPFGAGRVSIRSYLALLNFKANHRKLLISDNGADQWRALVSSANPHDGSSAHRNVAVQFSGAAVHDLMLSERALLVHNQSKEALAALDMTLTALSDGQQAAIEAVPGTPTLQILNESRIHEAIVATLHSAEEGDAVDLVMFYLSERKIVQALKSASKRGVIVKVLLDVNSDAFGRKKNGVPNLPVAAELVDAGIRVRWCATKGEQCHAKWLHVAHAGMHTYFLGSANFTRRNLLDFNLETDVRLTADNENSITKEMAAYFDRQWNNTDNRTYSLAYETYAQDNLWLTFQYRFMEATGLSTF